MRNVKTPEQLQEIIKSQLDEIDCLKQQLKDRTDDVNHVSVRWFDGYMEEFDATEVRFGSDLMFLRLTDGKNRQIPLRHVRWFSMSKESHQTKRGAYAL